MSDQTVQSVVSTLPPAMAVVLGLLVVAGLVLWLMGGRLARLACVVSGLVLGGLAGLALGRMLADEGAYVIPLVIGAAIAGALLAGLLFRVWVAVSGAALLALLAPALVLIWQGTPAPGATTDAPAPSNGTPALVEPAHPLPMNTMEAQDTGASTEAADATEETDDTLRRGAEQLLVSAQAAARTWYDEQEAHLRAWWDELGSAGQQRVHVAAVIGALVGLGLGLIFPYVAISLESALVGAILMLLPGRELLASYVPGSEGYLPQSPRSLLVWLGLITVLGFVIQWTLSGRKADK